MAAGRSKRTLPTCVRCVTWLRSPSLSSSLPPSVSSSVRRNTYVRGMTPSPRPVSLQAWEWREDLPDRRSFPRSGDSRRLRRRIAFDATTLRYRRVARPPAALTTRSAPTKARQNKNVVAASSHYPIKERSNKKGKSTTRKKRDDRDRNHERV